MTGGVQLARSAWGRRVLPERHQVRGDGHRPGLAEYARGEGAPPEEDQGPLPKARLHTLRILMGTLQSNSKYMYISIPIHAAIYIGFHIVPEARTSAEFVLGS